jgi:5-formyltetrahydrofolate cyclo-ligase
VQQTGLCDGTGGGAALCSIKSPLPKDIFMNTPAATAHKAAMRNHFRALRSRMTTQEVEEKSSRICRHLIAWCDQQPGLRQVFLFKAIENEPHLDLFAESLARRCVLGLPVCSAKGEMSFYSWHPGDTLQCNAWKIPEPLPGPTRRLRADAHTLIVVPCLAADVYGQRLGYGGGYYDRFLGTHRAGIKIGVVWAAQLQQKPLEGEPHDIRMNFLCSENGLLAASLTDPSAV